MHLKKTKAQRKEIDMQITTKEFDKLCKALWLFAPEDMLLTITDEEEQILLDADEVIRTVLERKEKMNARAYELIKEKRQSNPNYGRPKREWSKGKWKWRKKNV